MLSLSNFLSLHEYTLHPKLKPLFQQHFLIFAVALDRLDRFERQLQAQAVEAREEAAQEAGEAVAYAQRERRRAARRRRREALHRAAGDVVHAVHLQPGGRDAAPAPTEAGAEAAAVPLQGRRPRHGRHPQDLRRGPLQRRAL